LPLDVPTIEPRPKLDDGVEDGVDGSWSLYEIIKGGRNKWGTWHTIYDTLSPFENIMGGMFICGL
jgi:hypothetical protein